MYIFFRRFFLPKYPDENRFMVDDPSLQILHLEKRAKTPIKKAGCTLTKVVYTIALYDYLQS